MHEVRGVTRCVSEAWSTTQLLLGISSRSKDSAIDGQDGSFWQIVAIIINFDGPTNKSLSKFSRTLRSFARRMGATRDRHAKRDQE